MEIPEALLAIHRDVPPQFTTAQNARFLIELMRRVEFGVWHEPNGDVLSGEITCGKIVMSSHCDLFRLLAYLAQERIEGITSAQQKINLVQAIQVLCWRPIFQNPLFGFERKKPKILGVRKNWCIVYAKETAFKRREHDTWTFFCLD